MAARDGPSTSPSRSPSFLPRDSSVEKLDLPGGSGEVPETGRDEDPSHYYAYYDQEHQNDDRDHGHDYQDQHQYPFPDSSYHQDASSSSHHQHQHQHQSNHHTDSSRSVPDTDISPAVRASQHSQPSLSSHSHPHTHQRSHSPSSSSSTSSSSPPGDTQSRPTTAVVANATAADPKQTPIKRKPLSSTASPIATRYSEGASGFPFFIDLKDLPKPETRFSRAGSVDSPTLYEYPDQTTTLSSSTSSSTTASTTTPERDLPAPAVDSFPLPPQSSLAEKEHPRNPTLSSSSETDTHSIADPWPTRNTSIHRPVALQTATPVDTTLVPSTPEDPANNVTPTQSFVTLPTIRPPAEDDLADDTSGSEYSPRPSHDHPTMNIVSPKPTPPHLNLEKVEIASSQLSATTPTTTIATSPTVDSSNPPEINKPLPKSPGSSKFGNFFGWAVSPSPSTTEFSSLPSPLSAKHPGSTDDPATSGVASLLQRKGSKPNASAINPLGYLETNLLTPPPAPSPSPPAPAQIQEMEDELKAISAELAASIRREMDLEDLVDRLQSEVSNPQAPNKRTSDYFSDSGYSSTKFSEYDQNKEEVEKITRRAEQEKASVRLELTTKLQDERSMRKVLDQQIKELAEKASQIDLAQVNGQGASGRVRDLEHTCEDLRRRLAEEKTVKDNFEDLLSALRGELQDAANERDNLRDEIVPQLRARVEGLEAEASEYANLTYESTKMQQELQTLKTENQTLRSSGPKPEDASARSSLALSRSNSVTAGAFKLQRPPNGLSRTNTVKGGNESREALSERLKDVEAQRDALHSALRNLLERQEFQNRENEKKIKVLEVERDRLLTNSPRKANFEKDISNLRSEVKVLRRRAEEAIDQKWQAEKGLGGLKMDLDRAEEEIASLRALLNEKDILIPPSIGRASNGSNASAAYPVTSESLEGAFKDLQAAYHQSLQKIKELEEGGGSADGSPVSDERTRLAMQKLEQSLSAAVLERDLAKQEASALGAKVGSLNGSEVQHLQAEGALAEQLDESTRRVEELATQVRQQLAANAELRQRLASTVARGEADQKANAERITTMQSRLRALEEQLVTAQSASEDRITRHEEQIRDLKEAHNAQLRRASPSPVSNGMRSPALRGLSPMPSPMFPRSPRLGPQKSVEDEVQVEQLRSRVTELEKALSDADKEMQDVVAKMSEAQIEVLTLQEEREQAVRETRKLQRVLEEEKVKTFEDRFRTLRGNV